MIVFVLLILAILIKDMEFAPFGKYQSGYISIEQTNVIKGVFILLIFISHYVGYTELGGVLDETYETVRNHLNQAVVAMFMFYSGYGVMESTKKKGYDYVKSIPVKRVGGGCGETWPSPW